MKNAYNKKIYTFGILLITALLLFASCADPVVHMAEALPLSPPFAVETEQSTPPPLPVSPPKPITTQELTSVATPEPTPEPTPETVWLSLKREGAIKAKEQDPDHKYRLDLDGDGENETLTIETLPNIQDDDYYVLVKIRSGANSFTWKSGKRYSVDTFDIIDLDSTDGCVEILLHCGFTAGDTYLTALLRYNGTKLLHTTCSGDITKLKDSVFTVEEFRDLMGSYYFTMEYELSNEFELVKKEGSLAYFDLDGRSFKTKQPVPCEYEENGKYAEGELEKGTRVKFTATDFEQYVYFKAGERIGRFTFEYTKEGKPWEGVLIGGLREEKVFDGIEYEG